jgi:hypothetical protein
MPNILATLTRVAGIEREIWAGGLRSAGFAKGGSALLTLHFLSLTAGVEASLKNDLGAAHLVYKGSEFCLFFGSWLAFRPPLTSAHSRPEQKAFVLHADLTENHRNSAHNASPATPHVGHPADNNCVFVSCFLFMRTQWPRHR